MKTLKTSFICVMLVISICLPLHLIGQENEEAPTHEGLLLRFQLGGGPSSIDIGDDMTFKSSSSGLFHLQVGSEISENLVLLGDIGGFSLSDPDLESGGETATVEDAELGSYSYGIGLSYYIMPENIYLSGSIMLSRVTIEYQGNEGESKMGPGVFLSIGKEWWVGRKWGLGVAGFFEGASLKDKEDAQSYQSDINTQIIGIAFTATMY